MHPDICWPLARNRIRRGAENNTFGYTRRNADGSRRPHQGWDFEAVNGTPCFAISDGEIEKVVDGGDYGKQVVLRFMFDQDRDGDLEMLFAHYAHLSRFDVKPGDKVKAGQKIGLTGSTGNAAGMSPPDQHLHFEIRTVATPRRGLQDRYSPVTVFGHCPLEKAV